SSHQPGQGLSAGRFPSSTWPCWFSKTPTATSNVGLDMSSGPISSKLTCYPAGARATFQSPLQGFRTRAFDVFCRATQCAQPVIHNVQIVVLFKGVKRQP